jgi:hypothetical protein
VTEKMGLNVKGCIVTDVVPTGTPVKVPVGVGMTTIWPKAICVAVARLPGVMSAPLNPMLPVMNVAPALNPVAPINRTTRLHIVNNFFFMVFSFHLV